MLYSTPDALYLITIPQMPKEIQWFSAFFKNNFV